VYVKLQSHPEQWCPLSSHVYPLQHTVLPISLYRHPELNLTESPYTSQYQHWHHPSKQNHRAQPHVQIATPIDAAAIFTHPAGRCEKAYCQIRPGGERSAKIRNLSQLEGHFLVSKPMQVVAVHRLSARARRQPETWVAGLEHVTVTLIRDSSAFAFTCKPRSFASTIPLTAKSPEVTSAPRSVLTSSQHCIITRDNGAPKHSPLLVAFFCDSSEVVSQRHVYSNTHASLSFQAPHHRLRAPHIYSRQHGPVTARPAQRALANRDAQRSSGQDAHQPPDHQLLAG